MIHDVEGVSRVVYDVTSMRPRTIGVGVRDTNGGVSIVSAVIFAAVLLLCRSLRHWRLFYVRVLG